MNSPPRPYNRRSAFADKPTAPPNRRRTDVELDAPLEGPYSPRAYSRGEKIALGVVAGCAIAFAVIALWFAP